MLAHGPVTGLEALKIGGESVDPTGLVERGMLARAHCGTDSIKTVKYARLADTANMPTRNGGALVFTPDKKTDTITARDESERPNANEYLMSFGTSVATQLEQIQYSERINQSRLQSLGASGKKHRKFILQASLRSIEVATLMDASNDSDDAHICKEDAN